MFRVLLCVLAVTPVSAYAGDLESQAAEIIRQQGFWCGRVASINPTMFGQSANKSTYRVFCDDGREVANYEMEVGRGGSYIKVTEK